MATMKLTRLPTEADLDEFQIDLENFFTTFSENDAGPFKAHVQETATGVELDGYSIPFADWYTIEK
ncbi:hypothetical protein PQR65_18085 [Paraburkholderia nemoris]|uniref:hypothetical protein n=1 Tax=Paraburkholderia nemoris TaxID=2793076 RepID=UPI0038B809A3